MKDRRHTVRELVKRIHEVVIAKSGLGKVVIGSKPGVAALGVGRIGRYAHDVGLATGDCATMISELPDPAKTMLALVKLEISPMAYWTAD